MLHVSKSEVLRKNNSPSCTVWEYGTSSVIDAADSRINGRYPESGFALNETSTMSIRIISGVGRLATKQSSADLVAGDVALVPNGEAYYFEGKELSFFMACSPAWSLAQYSEIE